MNGGFDIFAGGERGTREIDSLITKKFCGLFFADKNIKNRVFVLQFFASGGKILFGSERQYENPRNKAKKISKKGGLTEWIY